MGSGKTFRAVYTILNDYKKYGKVFTDIGGFKYSNNIESVTYNKFTSVFRSLYQDYLGYVQIGEENLDIKLKQKLIDSDVLKNMDDPTLFVFDEAHNLFSSRSDPFLVWFISYHRHFNLDVILITQTYSLMARDYWKLIQEYVHSLPQSRMLFSKKFKYQHHITVPYYNANTLSKTTTLSLDPLVFGAYKSGDVVRTKSVLMLYLKYILFALGVGALGTFYMYNTFFGTVDDSSPSVLAPSALSPRVIAKKPLNLLKDSNLYTVRIWKTDSNHFYLDDVEYPIALLTLFINNYKPKKLLKVEDDFCIIETWLFSNEIISFLNQSKEKFKDSSSVSILNPFD
jgi:zona occludens toxin